MRYLLCIIAVAMLMFGGSIIRAEDAQDNENAKQCDTEPTGPRLNFTGTGPHHRVRSDDAEFGSENRREMPQRMTHDETTGLPAVVESDRRGEI